MHEPIPMTKETQRKVNLFAGMAACFLHDMIAGDPTLASKFNAAFGTFGVECFATALHETSDCGQETWDRFSQWFASE